MFAILSHCRILPSMEVSKKKHGQHVLTHLCMTWSWRSDWFSLSDRRGKSRKWTPPPSVPTQSRSHDPRRRRTVTHHRDVF